MNSLSFFRRRIFLTFTSTRQRKFYAPNYYVATNFVTNFLDHSYLFQSIFSTIESRLPIKETDVRISEPEYSINSIEIISAILWSQTTSDNEPAYEIKIEGKRGQYRSADRFVWTNEISVLCLVNFSVVELLQFHPPNIRRSRRRMLRLTHLGPHACGSNTTFATYRAPRLFQLEQRARATGDTQVDRNFWYYIPEAGMPP